MRIKAKIRIKGEKADLIMCSLKPDNMNIKNTDTGIDTDIEEDRERIAYFNADKISSLIASVDDYLMNAKIAQDMAEVVVSKETEKKEG